MTNPSLKPVKSSLIGSYEYNVASMELVVTFAGHDGDEYIYYNVPPPVVSAVFDTASSVGKAFSKLIRGKYKHSLKSEDKKGDE